MERVLGIRPVSMGICSSIPDPKGKGIRSAMVLANLKDNIDWLEVRHYYSKNAQ